LGSSAAEFMVLTAVLLVRCWRDVSPSLAARDAGDAT
jgi:hypothetical protein